METTSVDPTGDTSRDGAMIGVMLTAETMPTCAQRVLAVMQSIGDVDKSDHMSGGGMSYNFRGIERIAPRVRDACIEHGLLILPRFARLTSVDRASVEKFDNQGKSKGQSVTRVASVSMSYRFVNVDNPDDFLDVEMVGEANDTLDKAVTKALTSCHKYLLLQSFVIGDAASDPDRQLPDHDEERGEPTPMESWRADEEDVEALRVATTMLDETQRATFAAWWKRAQVGSIANRHVNARHIPAALALIETLLDSAPETQPASAQE